MFQNFDDLSNPSQSASRVKKLRKLLIQKDLHGYVIPHEDEFNNEYLPGAAERLSWLTGFTGSAGIAAVTRDAATVMSDGRYQLQLKNQTDPALFETNDNTDKPVSEWIGQKLAAGQQAAYDPRLFTQNAARSLERNLLAKDIKPLPLSTNLIDEIWNDQPDWPEKAVQIHPLRYAGISSTEKISALTANLKEKNADAIFIASPANVNWLLNIRGRDIKSTPLALCQAMVEQNGQVTLLIKQDRISSEVAAHLGSNIEVISPSREKEIFDRQAGKILLLDPWQASNWHFHLAKKAGARILEQEDPTLLAKACKNETEREGARQAHIRDGQAVSRFLHWLDHSNEVQSGRVDEIEAAQKLEKFRHETGALKDLSFETISGAGSDGAIIHYRVTQRTVKNLQPDELYLVDSGGQYLDGTTDITRTIAIGTPSNEMRRHYTLVLKGHIALAAIRFPASTGGSQLDILARHALWMAGLDYQHGTGHGVGSFLGVHEGPQRIAKQPNSVPLQPGMILSNEPGYYKEGHYGIRIENLQLVTEATPIKGGEIDMLGFETLTFAPLESKLIDTALLTPQEIDWVNHYHAQTLEKLAIGMDEDALSWLETACAPLEQ